MAIYRGAGGAGDATGDSASEALLVRELAAEVALDAAAAEAAKQAALAAQTAAELAETNAETAETNAETAEANAETAEANAETAQAAAEAAQLAAETAQTAAELAETNAETAETNAETAATAAASSASAASTSASNAATSATNASNSATAAATSATNSANSATASATSATNASNSATAAATSATNAANSATAAQTAETNAETAEANAETAQAAAEAAQLAAETAETNAETAETNAAASASAAATSATNASNSASAASTSASNASTSASNASASEIAAAASAAAAAASYDSFDDRYLGAKSSAPTLDNDGNALIAGALYYNDGTVTAGDKGMYVYDGSQWIAASAASTAILVVYKYTATSGQTTFTGNDDNSVALAYTAGSIIVTLNGVVLESGSEYTATSGTSVVLTTGAAAGDELNIHAFSTFDIANVYTQTQSDARYVDVTGDTMSGALLLPDGSASAPALSNDGDTNTGIFFPAADTIAFAEGGAEAMRINSSGNLGIGTTSPSTKLHVAGVAYSSTGGFAVGDGSSFTPSGLNLIPNYGVGYTDTGAVTSVTGFGGINFYTNQLVRMTINQSGDVSVANDLRLNILKKLSLYSISGTNGAYITTDGSGNIQLAAGTGGIADRLSILAGGDVQVRTASATLQLRTGVTNFDISAQAGATDFLRINGGGVQRFQFNAVGQAYNSTGTWGTISDARLKENIVDATSKLDKVNQLRVVNFNLKSDPDVKQIGFIAQEMEQVFPSLVQEGEEDGEGGYFKSVKTTVLIPILVKAIQEQTNIISDLKARIEALENK
jgi:hypothetical protein